MVDINNDGWLDIYVCNVGIKSGDEQDNELFIIMVMGHLMKRPRIIIWLKVE